MKANGENPCFTRRFNFKWSCQLPDNKTPWLDNATAVFCVLSVQVAIMKDHLKASIRNDGLFFRCF